MQFRVGSCTIEHAAPKELDNVIHNVVPRKVKRRDSSLSFQRKLSSLRQQDRHHHMGSPTADYEPTPRPGDNQHGYTAGSAQSSSTSSAEFNWRVTAFMLLWLLFMGLVLFVLLFSYCKNGKKQQNDSTPSVTAAPATAVALPKDNESNVEGGNINVVVAEEIVDVQLRTDNSSTNDSSSGKNSRKSIIYLIMVFSFLVALPLSIVVHTTCEYVGVDEDPDFLSLGLWTAVLTYNSLTNKGGEGVCYSYHHASTNSEKKTRIVISKSTVL